MGADAGELEALVQQRELRLELGEQPVERAGVDARGSRSDTVGMRTSAWRAETTRSVMGRP